jgi:hypothetical protein
VFGRLEQLKEAGVFAEKFGVVVDVKEMQATLKQLEPKNNHNIEGQLIYFPRLYEQQMEERKEGEIDDISLVPLNEELNLFSGDWMKEKQNPTIKVEESEEEINQTNYLDAEDEKIPPPLATSERKKVTKSKKKVKVNSDSGSDDLNMSSVSSGTINSNCNPEQLKRKREKE